MPSPTHKSNKVRRRKMARIGKSRKAENKARGTINFFTAFPTPAIDDAKTAPKKAATKK